jgi:hypothetical protein
VDGVEYLTQHLHTSIMSGSGFIDAGGALKQESPSNGHGLLEPLSPDAHNLQVKEKNQLCKNLL